MLLILLFSNFSKQQACNTCIIWEDRHRNTYLGFPGGSVVKNLPANTGDTDYIPNPGSCHMPRKRKIHVPQLLSLCSIQELKLLSPRATSTEAHSPKSPCSTTREATAVRSWCTTLERNPHSPQLEKSPRSNEDPVQSKINKTCIKKKRNTYLCQESLSFMTLLTCPDQAGLLISLLSIWVEEGRVCLWFPMNP